MKSFSNTKGEARQKRHARVRAKVSGTESMPRLAVFKSNRYMYAQLINDEVGMTIASASDLGAKGDKVKTDRARAVGTELAKLAKTKGVERVVFDRGGFLYTGRVKALADGAREGGLIF